MITREMLINEFVKTNWDDTAITVDTGDVVVVTPCAYADISSVDDCEYFLMNSDVVYLCGYDDIDSVVDTLNNFSALKAESEDDMTRLVDYFNKYLRNVSEHDWELSHKVINATYDMWKNAESPKGNLYDFGDAHVDEIADVVGAGVAEVKKAFELSARASMYSDWYKDVHGYRPRW